MLADEERSSLPISMCLAERGIDAVSMQGRREPSNSFMALEHTWPEAA